MERLSGSDATYLYMENPVVHMHVTGVVLLDPSEAPDGFDLGRFRRHVISRLDRIPIFRRRLVTVPLGIDHPVWVEDPDFDVDRHLWSHRLPRPGSAEQFAEFVGEYASHPLDHHRPLWDMVLVEGLADGRAAMVTKVHHVGVDGVSGTDLLAQLVDTTPDAPVPDAPVPDDVDGRPTSAGTVSVEAVAGPVEAVPGPVRMATTAVGSRLSDPLRGSRSLLRIAGSVWNAARQITGGDRGHTMARPFDAPRTLFNRSISERRSVAFASVPLDDIAAVREHLGGTINDVLLAACTQSLRSYLGRHGEHLDRPLVVSVPVSVHGRDVDGGSTNQVSDMFVRLPAHLADPVEQLRAVQLDSSEAKALHGALGPTLLGDVTDLVPPMLFQLAGRMYSSAGLADRLPPIHNLVVSNVPGPPVPLYVAGARVEGLHPFGPLVEGSGLNISALSNVGQLDLGVIACPEVAPRPAEVADGIVEAVRALRTAAERGSTTRTGDPTP